MGSAISIIVWMERNINRPVNRLLHVKASGFGAKVGLFSTAPFGKDRGWVDADWFRIEK